MVRLLGSALYGAGLGVTIASHHASDLQVGVVCALVGLFIFALGCMRGV